MKKSEMYQIAMRCVIQSAIVDTDVKIDIIELLRADKSLEEWREENEARKEAEEAAKKAEEMKAEQARAAYEAAAVSVDSEEVTENV